MTLNEIVKSFLKQPEESIKDLESSKVAADNVLVDLTNNDMYPTTGSFLLMMSNSTVVYLVKMKYMTLYSNKKKRL